MNTIDIASLQDMPNAAQEFIAQTTQYSTFAFHGSMGVGKTTFIKTLCKELLVREPVVSPTFAIVNEYSTQHDTLIYHFDLYRIETLEELLQIGAEDYFYSGNFCFIEWPEIAEPILPPHTIHVSIIELENGVRRIEF